MNFGLLRNSLLVSALSTLLALTLGFITALFVNGLNARGRRCFMVLAVLTLALPPFLVTDCWMTWFGQSGWLGKWSALSLETPDENVRQLVLSFETAWVLALMLWPVSLLLVLGAWQRLEANLLENEPLLSGGALFRRLLAPLARDALTQAAVVTFVLALNNFAVPALLQVKVFPAEVWVNFNTTFDYGAAAQMSWPLVAAPLALLFWLRRREISWPRVDGAATAGVFRRQLGARWFAFSGVAAWAAVALSVGVPLTRLCASVRTWHEFVPAVLAGQGAILDSAMLPAVSATLVIVAALATWRWPIGPLTWLPFLVPGVLLGMALIFVFNRPPFIAFYESVGIVFFAWTVRYLAVGWNTTAQALRSVDADLSDAARLEGASRWQSLRLVQWPQVAPLVAAGWYLTYLFCLWDAETLILVMPPGAETLAIRVFNFLHYGHNAQVNALCLVLLMLAVAPVAIWSGWRVTRNLKTAAVSALPLAPLAALMLAGCAPATSQNEAPVESKLFSRVQVIGTRGAGLGEFNKPRSVAVDAKDNLYVVDMTGRVQKFSPDGTFLSFWQMPQTDKGKPKGMCRDEKGNIVVLEPHYSRVNHFTTDGRLVAQWGVHGTNAGELAFPRSVIVNSQGDIFVSEYGLAERLQEFTSEGAKLVRVIGGAGTGEGQFDRAEGLGIDRQDRIYVADSCNHRIQVFSPDGKFLRTYGRPGAGRGELSYPYDVKVDAQGFQFVCEFGNSRIQVFDREGQPVEIIGGPGAGPGQFSNPWGMAFDSKDNLYVADAMNHRVQKFIRKKAEAGRAGPELERDRAFGITGNVRRASGHGPG
ncbi:MAG TPA: ABC transporter permease subunit [Candidatus Angelobacter sp.]|nr:ABC transporter permease subunit [Candidatus Angelobacter sp.]